MTIQIDLDPQLEAQLRKKAEARQVPVDSYVQEVLFVTRAKRIRPGVLLVPMADRLGGPLRSNATVRKRMTMKPLGRKSTNAR
jgi:hypothetical protein